MITKKYSKDGKKCDVTFELSAEIDSSQAYLCGDFSEWTPEQMEPKEDGGFSISLSLKPNHNYQFRYRLDDERWENDTSADELVPNPFGSQDSILQL